MKILWLKGDFLHPTTRGGKIRTLEMLKRLHRRHEVHFIALDDGTSSEAIPRASEYSTHAYPVPHHVPIRGSAAFYAQSLGNLFSDLPLSLARYKSSAYERTVDEVIHRESPDVLVCDFLTPAVNIDKLDPWVLFQHNVETIIWRRHAEQARGPVARRYFQKQAERMFRVEEQVSKAVKQVVAVSEADARTMENMFGLRHIPSVPTGVDVEGFTPRPTSRSPASDLVFVGAMDWMPNIDGVIYFLDEILPLVRRRKPDCSVAIVGRKPSSELRRRAAEDPKLLVTGTVEDVRPYLWSGLVSIVPLRIGGGTRLKIYEAMAAKIPVVSTSIGAEGLDVQSKHIRLADTPDAFAAACIDLLEDREARERMAEAAWHLVSTCFSWERVTEQFERIVGL